MSQKNLYTAKIGSGALTLLGAYQVLLGLYFVLVRPSLLPEDLRYMQSTANTFATAAPQLANWLQWVFAVLGGQMIAVGTLVLALAFRARGVELARGEVIALAIAGGASALLMSVTNFAIRSDFRWVLIIPVVLWSVALIGLGASKTE